MMSELTIEHFERMIYLPMLLTILDRDLKALEVASVKFVKPYVEMVRRTIDAVHKDLTETNLYFKKHRLKLHREGNDGTITAFLFVEGQNHYQRRYLNVRLRNRSEELLGIYLRGGGERGNVIQLADRMKE